MRTQDGYYEINVQVGQAGHNTETEKIETDNDVRILDGHFLFLVEHFDVTVTKGFDSH